jgi:hypothetical protein
LAYLEAKARAGRWQYEDIFIRLPSGQPLQDDGRKATGGSGEDKVSGSLFGRLRAGSSTPPRSTRLWFAPGSALDDAFFVEDNVRATAKATATADSFAGLGNDNK